MKVAQVTFRFAAPGGVETNVREIARRLQAWGDDVRVFSGDLYDESSWARRTTFENSVEGISTSWFPAVKRLIPWLTLPLMPGLMDAISRYRPNVIHAHSHRYGHVLQAAAVARGHGIPLVVSTHYHPPHRREPASKRALLRAQDVLFGMTAYREAERIIVETNLEARLVSDFAPRHRISVIAPGIDLEAWPPGSSMSSPPGLPERFVLYSGRLAANKGLDVLVNAMALIPSARRPKLVLMGRDWGVRAELEEIARKLGIGDALVFLGHVDAPAYQEVFRRARAFVLPSEWEAFGLVLLEAMAAGVPIVATNVGGVPEVLEFGRSGILVDFGDAGALAGALESLETDPTRRSAFVDSGRVRVNSFSWDHAARAHQKLYQELAS